jgi:hypothetical protein
MRRPLASARSLIRFRSEMLKDKPFGTLAGHWLALMTSSFRFASRLGAPNVPRLSNKRATDDARIDLDQTLRVVALQVIGVRRAQSSHAFSRRGANGCHTLFTPDGVRTAGLYGLLDRLSQWIATRLARGGGRTVWMRVGLHGVRTLAYSSIGASPAREP